MKKISVFAVILAVIVSCAQPGSGDDGPALTNVPDAKVADDNAATGVYKGVLADSDASGTYMIEITEEIVSGNDRSSRAADPVYRATIYLTVNGSTVTKSGTATYRIGGGIDVVISADAAGKQFSLNMVIESDGNVIQATVKMDGQAIEATTVKEKSTQLVEAYQGTFTGSAIGLPSGYWANITGTWNFIVVGDRVEGVYKGKDSSNIPYQSVKYYSDSYTSTILSNGSMVINFNDSYSTLTASGMKTGTKVSGTWADNDDTPSVGTWKGSRTR